MNLLDLMLLQFDAPTTLVVFIENPVVFGYRFSRAHAGLCEKLCLCCDGF